MLAGQAAAHLDAGLENLAADFDRAPHLVRVAFVVEHDRMDIAVAGVEDIADREPIEAAEHRDHAQNVGQPRARHHAVLGGIVGRKPPDRAERALARLP